MKGNETYSSRTVVGEQDVFYKQSGVKSIRMEKEKMGKASGFWKGITSTEAQEFTYSVGITSTDSNSTTESSAQKLNSSMESGWNASVTAEAKAGVPGFGEVGVSGTVGKTGNSKMEKARENLVSQEISSTASVGTTTTHFTTCTPKEGESRAGLWQWVITTEDYSTTAFTSHTVCRTGDLAFKSPICAYWDCANADCSKCLTDATV